MLVSDNWLEIMKHLDIDLISLSMISKQLYQLYINNKNILCDEGNYRFSSYQHQLKKTMLNHINKPYHQKQPLMINKNNNIGTKSAILSTLLTYKGTSVIICPKKENEKWKQEICKLLGNQINILICAHQYCDKKLLKYYYHHDCDPNLLGYKIVIVNKGDFTQISKHSMTILYKKSSYDLCNNTIIVGYKCNHWLYEYIEYPYVLPIKTINHLCCYNDEDYILPYTNNEHLYKPLKERLDSIIHHIIHYYQGPYLIIGNTINTSFPLKSVTQSLRSNDIVFITYKQIRHVLYLKIKTIILLWPQKYYELPFNVYHLNIFNIYSIIEEKCLQYIDQKHLQYFNYKFKKRNTLDFINLLKSLPYNINYIPHHYLTLLMYINNQDLPKIYKLIDHYFKDYKNINYLT